MGATYVRLKVSKARYEAWLTEVAARHRAPDLASKWSIPGKSAAGYITKSTAFCYGVTVSDLSRPSRLMPNPREVITNDNPQSSSAVSRHAGCKPIPQPTRRATLFPMFRSGFLASMAPADSSLVPTATSTLPRLEPVGPLPQRVRAPKSFPRWVHTKEAIPAASRLSTPPERGQP